MLKEYILHADAHLACWSSSVPGIQSCRFQACSEATETLQEIPVQGEQLHFEAFFCLSGRLVVELLHGSLKTVEAPGIFLISDCSQLISCRCSKNLSGILVAVDALSAKESLQDICQALELKLDTTGVKNIMEAQCGCMTLFGTPWTQAFFETMRDLPDDAQNRYCVFKSVELLYLLCSKASLSYGCDLASPPSVAPVMLEVKTYLEEHLSEKLTIPFLCKQFSFSATFLKKHFRSTYGVPIHTYLIQQRLQRARNLICTTGMPIQQIAQTVGYEGMSQFNAAFKRHYGMSPGQYRKMSETATLRPF